MDQQGTKRDRNEYEEFLEFQKFKKLREHKKEPKQSFIYYEVRLPKLHKVRHRNNYL